MKITTNGEPREIEAQTTLAELVASLTPDPHSLATALNGDFIPRAARAGVQLREGDAVFTFQPITGG